jgi:3-oxoacyl-[acyl-carrier protein] reductase
MNDLIDLKDRRVLVTGGSRGIGAACCRMFARAGAAVLVHYRADEGAAGGVLAELAAISGRPHRRFAADLARAEGVDALFAFLDREWGRLDCLVNNAGIWEENPIDALDAERLERTWRLNVTAPFLCARAAVPYLRRSPDGSIVNVTSTSGQRGEARYSPYSASKGALISATKAWSSELAPAVRVNSVAPGWVDTDMCTEPFAGGGKEAIGAGIPLGRVATPEEIAGPVVFLASALARHVTGEILNVNGGSVLMG